MRPLPIILTAICLMGITAIPGFGDDSARADLGQAAPEVGPPAEIQALAFMVGTWDYKGKMRWDPSSEEWIEHEAVSEISYIPGGAALQTIFHGEMGGMDMYGFSLLAFDRTAGAWQETWVDNLSGRISLYAGHTVDGKRIISGEDMVDGKIVYTRNTTYDITSAGYKWKMENSLDGENWYVSMEGIYTKR